MEFLMSAVSFDNVMMSLITCLIVREIMLVALPDEVAGPGGWLIDTGDSE
ncbi:MAG: hypothetical protein AAGA87_05385 [Pseudomonadota bacterium]